MEEFAKGNDVSLVLMSISENYHPDVYRNIREYFTNIAPVIEFYSLELSTGKTQNTGVDIIYDNIELSPEEQSIRDEMVADYFSVTHAFGNEQFYQSFPRLGIPGERPTDVRLF